MSRRSALDLLVDTDAHHDTSPAITLINEMVGISLRLPDLLAPFEMSDEALRQMHENYERKFKKRPREEAEGTPSKRLRSSARLNRDSLNTSLDDPFLPPPPRREEGRERELRDRERGREKEREVKREDHALAHSEPSSPFAKKQVSEDDIMALMNEAKRLKHEGDQRRKEAKMNDPILDKFLVSYLEASLYYIRCGQYYEKHQKRDWLELAKKLYDDTAKLAQFAAAQVRFPCSDRRRALTALLEKTIAVCYGRKFHLEKKQLQVLIHAGSGDSKEDRMSVTLAALDRSANDAASFWLKSRRSAPSLEEMEGEFERPLQVSAADFLRYTDRTVTALYGR